MRRFIKYWILAMGALLLLSACDDDKKIEALRTLYNSVKGEYTGQCNGEPERVVVNCDEGGLFLTFDHWNSRRFFLKKADSRNPIYEFRGTDAYEDNTLVCIFNTSLRKLEINELRSQMKFVGKK